MTTTSVCPIIQDDTLHRAAGFGGRATVAGVYALDIATCNAIVTRMTSSGYIIPLPTFPLALPADQ